MKSDDQRESEVKTNSGVYCARSTADLLLAHILKDSYRSHCVPAYLTCLCSGIEGIINELYIDFFYKKIGRNYKSLVKPFFKIPFKERLALSIPLISNYKYQINTSHKSLPIVYRMFELRNALIHVKHHWHPARITDNESTFNIEYLNPAEIDIYAQGIEKALTEDDYNTFMTTFREFISSFSHVGDRINRKNFNPKDWFTLLKSKKA